MNEITERIAHTLEKSCFVEMEASGRHVHLTKETAHALFGQGLTNKLPLSQPGQYVCSQRVTLKGPKGTLERVAVLGPERKEDQAEISLTDAVILGVTPPVRLSGDLHDAASVTVIGERGEAICPCIAALRHMHMTPEDARTHGLKNGDSVRVRVVTDRSLVFENVAVRVSPEFATRLHLDYDEANACHFKKGDLGLILHE